MYKIRALFTVIFLTVFVCDSFAQQTAYKENEILVRFAADNNNKSMAAVQRNSILASAGVGQVKRTLKSVPNLSVVEIPAGLSVEEAIKELQGKSGVLHVQPNFIYRALSTFPNEIESPGRFNEQWGLNNIGQTGGTVNADINAPEAWDKVTSSNIIVAVIDSGVDYTHPDLAANMWTDANGCYGYDFVNDDNDPFDDNGHGTHVAGILGAVGNNDIGVAGVCWNVKIMALKYLNSNNSGDTEDAIDCIFYAVNNGAKILNNSWGGDYYDQELKDMIEYANANGVLFIAGAGNVRYDPGPRNIDIDEFYPASFDCENIITVMATNHNDEQANYSYYGPNSVDLAAPGGEFGLYDYTAILSTVPGGDYDYKEGTSMSTPYVAGACALVWATNEKFTHMQVKSAILNSVDELDSLDGLCATEGRLNLHKAVSQWPLQLTKTDNVPDGNSVMPYHPLLDNLLEYTIAYDACGISDANVILTDYLPVEVDYYDSVPQGNYDSNSRTVKWNIGLMGPSDSNSFVLKVAVNNSAVPGGTIVNVCQLEGNTFSSRAIEVTPVDCFGDGIIYVDDDANDYGDGRTWDTAFNDLYYAIEFVKSEQCFDTIYVAAGTYPPANDVGVTDWYERSFELADGIKLYGHFAGNEAAPSQRVLSEPAYATILQGEIAPGTRVRNVVTAVHVTDTLLDGFTITAASYDGVALTGDCNIPLANCIIINSNGWGLNIPDGSSVQLANCSISGNNYGGIYKTGTGNVSANDCVFGCNGYDYLVYLQGSSPKTFSATDCIFDGNDISNHGIDSDNNTAINISRCSFTGLYSPISTNSTVLNISDSKFDDSSSGSFAAICADTGDATITNCLINAAGSTHGVYFDGDGHLDVLRCKISGANYGIYSYNSDTDTIRIEGCKIYDNVSYGVYIIYSDGAEIINNWFFENNYGVYLSSNNAAVNVRNNTVAYNTSRGIYSSGTAPQITNCIVWNPGADDLYNCTATYSCIENGDAGPGNISSDPCFVNACVGNFHLLPDSLCIDRITLNYPDESDIDGEDRTRNGLTDMGADEFCWPSADYNQDEIVNFLDYSILATPDVVFDDLALFADDWLWTSHWGNKYDLNNDNIINFIDESILARSWLLSSGDPDFDRCCDFAQDGIVDMNDFTVIVENWLWADRLRYLEMTSPRPEITIAEEPVAEPLTPEQIDEILGWLDDLWNSGELQEIMTYEEYIEFRNSIMDLGLDGMETLSISSQTVSLAVSSQPQITQEEVEEIVNWVDDLWSSGEIQKIMTYEEYLDFRKSVEDTLKSEY